MSEESASFTITFSGYLTTFQRSDVADTPDLAAQLSVKQRMIRLLGHGSVEPARIAEEIDADLETVKRTARRYRKLFTVIEGGKIDVLDSRKE